MKEDSSDLEIPPFPELEIVAEGSGINGETWEVKAGGSREQCWTVMDIKLPDGRTAGGGGMGGPALPEGKLVNFSFHHDDKGCYYLVGRVDPTIRRVEVELSDGHILRLDVSPIRDLRRFGTAFTGGILPENVRPTAISAFDVESRLSSREEISHSWK